MTYQEYLTKLRAVYNYPGGCNTGGYVSAVFAAIHVPLGPVPDLLLDPAFAGYCIDAPAMVPSGGSLFVKRED